MSKMKVTYIPYTFLTLSLLLGCHPKATDEIGFGEYSDGVYSNDYLGFNISLPSDWNIQNSEQRTELMKKGAEVVRWRRLQSKENCKNSRASNSQFILCL
jgi:hypothetical protein